MKLVLSKMFTHKCADVTTTMHIFIFKVKYSKKKIILLLFSVFSSSKRELSSNQFFQFTTIRSATILNFKAHDQFIAIINSNDYMKKTYIFLISPFTAFLWTKSILNTFGSSRIVGMWIGENPILHYTISNEVTVFLKSLV